jgi:hypothetical protein
MFSTCKWIARNYPNATLVVLGLAFIIVPELHSNAVFRAYSELHYQNWSAHPLVARTVDLWWWAEHRTLFMVVAISVTATGAIMALVGALRWLVQWVRRTNHKKHGVAFWSTVLLGGVSLVYLVSFGPASWLLVRCPSPDWAVRAHHQIYAPMIWAMQNGPSPLPKILAWYTTVGTTPLF